jgi:Helix-turn-helix.
MEKLGERIRKLRGKIPRGDFANLLGVSSTGLFNYEAGDRVPGADILERLCLELNVNPKWLLLGQGPVYESDWVDVYDEVAKDVVDTVLSVTDEGENLHSDAVLHLVEIVRGQLFDSITKRAGEIFIDEYGNQLKEEDLAAKIIDASEKFRNKNAPVKVKKQSSSPKPTTKSNTQIAKGSHIIQAGGSINNVTVKSTTRRTNVAIQPPSGSIGANALLTERIKGLFNELGLRREERFGKSAYPVMYNEFKKEFGIPKNQKYTTYLLWDEARATEIVEYIESKIDNTIKGRVENAAKRKGHSIPVLLGETRKLHEMLGWRRDEYRAHLHMLFGVTSRSDLNQSQLANYVRYLKGLIDATY